MNCPRCQVGLAPAGEQRRAWRVHARHLDPVGHLCPSCGGRLLDDEGLRALSPGPYGWFRRRQWALKVRWSTLSDAPVSCPSCGWPMRRIAEGLIIIDGCPKCSAYWFDPGEAGAVLGSSSLSTPEGGVSGSSSVAVPGAVDWSLARQRMGPLRGPGDPAAPVSSSAWAGGILLTLGWPVVLYAGTALCLRMAESLGAGLVTGLVAVGGGGGVTVGLAGTVALLSMWLVHPARARRLVRAMGVLCVGCVWLALRDGPVLDVAADRVLAGLFLVLPGLSLVAFALSPVAAFEGHGTDPTADGR